MPAAQVALEGPAAASYHKQVQALLDQQGLRLFGGMPRSALLRVLGLNEVAAALGCKPLTPGEEILQVGTSEVSSLPATT